MIEKKEFVFIVLTYNHANYIVEHLESIKYLVYHYGDNYNIKLVIGDDGSKDDTLEIVKFWLSQNITVFSEVVVKGDGVNRGTCANYTGLWAHITSPYFKVTAGDDVYSYENLFAEVMSIKDTNFISGLPLILQDGVIFESRSTTLHILATAIIYNHRQFIDRLKKISMINTPSLIYSSQFVKDQSLFEFVRTFRVVEDYPFMVKIAYSYQNIRFKQLEKVLVYYRRTAGSAYLVSGSAFANDKVKVFNYIFSNEKSWLTRLFVKNNIWCFLSNNKFKKKYLNLNYYEYAIRLVVNGFSIFKKLNSIKMNVFEHSQHYAYIHRESEKILKLYKNNDILT